MTWLISKALAQAYANSPCSQAQAVESSEESCSDGKPSALSSGKNTPQAYCAPDKMKDFSRLSRFGMTFNLLTESHGAALLTWYLADFHAKTLALPVKAQASRVNARECGAKWRGSLARFDRDLLLWKTAQRSLLGDSEPSSVIWPRSGMTADGQCWELPMLERTTNGTDSGFWLPTPCATDAGSGRMNTTPGSSNQRPMLALMARKNLWPTPTTQDNVQVRGLGAAANAPSRGTTLGGAVRMWPTPLANSHTGAGHGPNKTGAPNLQTMVKKWPTPTVNDSKNSTLPESQRERDGLAGSLLRMGEPIGGQLNPTFVEWLMGWPLGWTELKPLAMDKCHCVQQPHGNCLGGN